MGTTIINQDPCDAKSSEDDPLKEPRDHCCIVIGARNCTYLLGQIVTTATKYTHVSLKKANGP